MPIEGLYDRFFSLLGIIAAALVAFMAFGISIDVVMRNLGLGVISWMLEVTEYCLYLTTLVGAPWVLYRNSHVRIDIIVTALSDGAARWLDIFANLVGVCVSGILFYYSASIAVIAFRNGALVIKELIFPEWWIFAVFGFSAALLVIEFFRRLAHLFRGRRLVDPHERGETGL